MSKIFVYIGDFASWWKPWSCRN